MIQKFTAQKQTRIFNRQQNVEKSFTVKEYIILHIDTLSATVCWFNSLLLENSSAHSSE